MQFQNIMLFIGNLGGWEFMLILVAILLLFGAKKLPELARGLGKGIREFKDATTQIQTEISTEANSPVQATQTADPASQRTEH